MGFNLFKKRKPEEIEQNAGLFSKLKSGLTKTRQVLTTDINELFVSSKAIDDSLFDELEELLVTSDLGIDISMDMMEKIKKKAKKLSTADELRQVLKEELIGLFPEKETLEKVEPATRPHVIMVVGVNGTGKTTTLGKLAMKFTTQGKKVLIAAADTFRAAAVDQLSIWADRVGVEIVKQDMGSDPASVAFDTLSSAVSGNADVVIIDTAGRLHNKVNLMNELTKIRRVMQKVIPEAPHEILLILDGSTGQNAFEQAKEFTKATDVNALALTKLDGTAKGGVVLGISDQFQIPVKYIGIGEKLEDLQIFDRNEFVDSLFSQ